MTQTTTGKGTSINSRCLPASTKKIDWKQYQGQNVLDVGGGKFDNLKDYLFETYSIRLYIYDPYNRGEDENNAALSCNPAAVISNNVLNVVDCDESLIQIIDLISSYNVPYYISVHEGDRSGIGKITGKDSYQRHAKTKDYLKFFKGKPVVIKDKVIMG